MVVVSGNMYSFDFSLHCTVSIGHDTIPVSMTPLSDEPFDNNGNDNSENTNRKALQQQSS